MHSYVRRQEEGDEVIINIYFNDHYCLFFILQSVYNQFRHIIHNPVTESMSNEQSKLITQDDSIPK